MSVAVIIPWRAGCPYRSDALEHVLEFYRTRRRSHWELVIGEHTAAGEWCKAIAVTNALETTAADMLVVADADVICDGIELAVEHCQTWAVPHRFLHRLDEQATAELYETGEPGAGRTEKPYTGHAGGGIVVIRRDVYESCPLDPRFVGWGQEDDAWAHALTTMFRVPWRGTADMFHLWHPPQERLSRTTGSRDGRLLYRRYRNAARSRVVMESLLAEVMPCRTKI